MRSSAFVSNETNGDALLTLGEAAKLLPNRPHASALWRWCRRGLKSRGGRVVRLAHLRIGGRLYVRREDLEAFGRKLAEADVEGFDRERESAL